MRTKRQLATELELIKIRLKLERFEEQTKKFNEIGGPLKQMFPDEVGSILKSLEEKNFGLAIDNLEILISHLWNEGEGLNCNGFWRLFELTGNEKVRYCTECRKSVYLCESIGELKNCNSLSQNVAFKESLVHSEVISPNKNCFITNLGLPKGFSEVSFHDTNAVNYTNKIYRNDSDSK